MSSSNINIFNTDNLVSNISVYLIHLYLHINKINNMIKNIKDINIPAELKEQLEELEKDNRNIHTDLSNVCNKILMNETLKNNIINLLDKEIERRIQQINDKKNKKKEKRLKRQGIDENNIIVKSKRLATKKNVNKC